MFSHREQTLFFFERTWWSQLQVTHALIQPEQSCYGEPVLLRKMLALWSGLTSTRLQKACIKLLWASVLIWGLKRCKVRARLLMLDDSLLLGVPNGEGWLHRPADYSLDAVVLQPISVLNETLVIEVHIPVGLARVCIYSHYFFLPSIFFSCGWLWLAQCAFFFLHKILAFFHDLHFLLYVCIWFLWSSVVCSAFPPQSTALHTKR